MTKSASVPALLLLLLGVTCVVHVTTAQPTPAGEGQRAVERTLDEDYSELDGQPLIEFRQETGGIGKVPLNTPADWLRLGGRLLLASLFITMFGLWIAFLYAAPFGAPRVRRSFNEIDSFETHFRNDPIDIVLDFLNVEDFDGSRCRERLVCDARHLVSTLPYISSLLGTSSNTTGSTNATQGFKYAEAATRGAARENCSIYKCPHTSAQLVTGWL